MKGYLRYLGSVLVLGILTLALLLLYWQVRRYDPEEVAASIGRIPSGHLAAAIAFTVLNYLVLIFYDLLNIRFLGYQFPVRKIALASLISYMVSNTFGMLFGGTAVRYRLYSTWGLSIGRVAELIALLGLTFWLGVFALAGVLFVAAPFQIPPSLEHHTGLTSVIPVGAGLLAFVGVYLLATAFYRRPIRIRGWVSQLPPLRISLYQILIASSDITIAGAVFYVLLPPDSGVSFPSFLAVYLLGVVVAVLTHVPGQFGVLDLIILGLYGVQNPGEAAEPVLAAVLVYRVVYTLLPLLIASVLLAAYEIHLHRHWLAGAWRTLSGAGRAARQPEKEEPTTKNDTTPEPPATPPSDEMGPRDLVSHGPDP